MATQPPIAEQPAEDQARQPKTAQAKPAQRTGRAPIGQILRELDWTWLLVLGLGMGALWAVMLRLGGFAQILAGLLPVTAGIMLGRRAKQHIYWHAALLGVLTTFAAVATAALVNIVAPLPPSDPMAANYWQVVLVGVVTLLPFPAFGVITAARGEQRRRDIVEVQSRRGGKLDRPGRIRSVDELRSLSLPQLGGYVSDLFRKHGFLINDYRFEKDRLDFQVSYEGEPWLLRVVTAEKVKPGVAQELSQRMRAEDVTKGVVITSMDFQDNATRWAKDKSIALIDGPTLISMND